MSPADPPPPGGAPSGLGHLPGRRFRSVAGLHGLVSVVGTAAMSPGRGTSLIPGRGRLSMI